MHPLHKHISRPAPLTPFTTRRTKRCSDLPKETPKGSVSAQNSTSHPDESKGMKLARMRFWFLVGLFFSEREGNVWKISVCKGGYFAGREMISLYSGTLEMENQHIGRKLRKGKILGKEKWEGWRKGWEKDAVKHCTPGLTGWETERKLGLHGLSLCFALTVPPSFKHWAAVPGGERGS